MNDFFSLLNPDIFRLPGIFRLRDVFFVTAFFPLLLKVYKRETRSFTDLLPKAIWLIICSTLIEIILTMYVQNQNINFTIRMGRRYLYYLIYFPLIYLIDDHKRFKRFMFLIISSSLIYSGFMILQYALGPSHIIFKYAAHVEEQEIAGQYVTRSYSIGNSLAIITFFYFAYRLYYNPTFSVRSVFIVLCTFLGGVYLEFSRANLFGVMAGMIFTICIYFRAKDRIKFLLLTMCLIAFISLGFEVINSTTDESFKNPIVQSGKALYSGVADLVYKRGTFGFRLEDSASRIALIKKHPIFGIGFVHPDSAIINISTVTSGIITADSGLITLLLDFGLLGPIWLLIVSIIFYNDSRKAFNANKDVLSRNLIMAAISFYFSRLFSVLTLIDYVDYPGVVSLCIVFFSVTFLGNADRTADYFYDS